MEKVIIGDATLYHGDCLEIIQEIGGYDVLVADPPYKMETHRRGFCAKRGYFEKLGEYGTHEGFELSGAFYEKIIEVLPEVNLVIFCNKMMKLDIENWAVSQGYNFDEIVMCKSSPPPLINNQWLPDKEFAVHVFKNCSVKGGMDTKCSWFVAPNFKSDIDHPSVKPLYIMERVVRNVSNMGDTVLDTFMGSGSTGVAALRNGRKFIGIEINKEYFDIACERMKAVYNEPDLFRPNQTPEQDSLLKAL